MSVGGSQPLPSLHAALRGQDRAAGSDQEKSVTLNMGDMATFICRVMAHCLPVSTSNTKKQAGALPSSMSLPWNTKKRGKYAWLPQASNLMEAYWFGFKHLCQFSRLKTPGKQNFTLWKDMLKAKWKAIQC